ncbi:fungal-specific transcription factor domain-containing protein [Mycena floridula]|nr:fungal-specific transcription factor domain-containing protein [Mycena floridula]
MSQTKLLNKRERRSKEAAEGRKKELQGRSRRKNKATMKPRSRACQPCRTRKSRRRRHETAMLELYTVQFGLYFRPKIGTYKLVYSHLGRPSISHGKALTREDDLQRLLANDEAQSDSLDDDLRLIPRTDTVALLGQSSGKSLLHLALHVKENSIIGIPDSVLASVRPSFWSPWPWETSRFQRRPNYDFPSDDLMTSLVDLFFHHLNSCLPLLHRPTFERSIAQGLHLDTSSKFGTVVCLVCAVGSRWSDDPRVLSKGHESHFSSGWKWYAAVRPYLYGFLESYTQPPSLYDLQATCLSAIFTIGGFSPHAMWSQVGIAIRAAQSIGVHRKKPWYKQMANPVTNELFKRAWWVLVVMDRILSASMGRPCMIRSEDFDVELPTDCDDEYWEHSDPTMAFKQPSDKPSIVSPFLSFIQLSELTALALRMLYTKTVEPNPRWDQNKLAHLDSAINQWAEDLPDHLRWENQNPKFLSLSAELQCAFYRLQMLVHRPFLTSPGKQSPLATASLAICTNAARSCSRVVEMHYQKTGLGLPFAKPTIFNSGVVLLLQIWEGQRAGLDVSEKRADVQRCIDALERSASRWPSAFNFKAMLEDLAVSEARFPEMQRHMQEFTFETSAEYVEQDELLNLFSGAMFSNPDLYDWNKSPTAAEPIEPPMVFDWSEYFDTWLDDGKQM